MEDLLFCLNATVPIFLTMLLGCFFKKVRLMDDSFVKKLNRFVFTVALPVQLFENLATVDIREVWDTRFVLFCFLATIAGIILTFLLSGLLKDKSVQGEFMQVCFRSNTAILGIAFIENIYGKAVMAPLMIVAVIPVYNVMAVVVLSVLKPQREKISRELVIKTLKGIVTNPIIIGIMVGICWSLLRIPMPQILGKTVRNVAVLATPLGLMAIGASFELRQAFAKAKPAIGACFMKLIGLAALFLPIAAALGFRGEKMVAVLVMSGSSSAVSCYIMAKNMGHEGTLTSCTVMLTTLFSAFTLTGWLYLLRITGMI